MASRPVWEGHLRLSLVSCPVSMFNATSAAHEVHFHLISPKTNSRVRMQMLDSEGHEVNRKELLKGYEVEKDQYVLLTDEEIKSVRLESTRTLDIERFVDASSIDRIWWNDPYYLVPDGKAGVDAFTVIRTAMEQAGKVALARVVMSTRERVVAIEPRGAGMLVTTLRSKDEIRDDADFFEDIPKGKSDARMIEIAQKIIEQQAGAFDPGQFNDRYEEALRALIESKQGGDGGGVTAPPPQNDNVIDLMEALRRSLEGSDGGKRVAAKAQGPAAKPAPKAAAKPAPKPAAKPAPAKRRASGK